MECGHGQVTPAHRGCASRTVLSDKSEKYLFLNSADGDMRVLDATSGDEVQSLRLGTRIETLAISLDERRLVTADLDGQVYVYRMDLNSRSKIITSELPEKFKIHDDLVYAMDFAADGESLLTVAHGGRRPRRTRLNAQAVLFPELSWIRNRICVPIPGTDLVAATGPLCICKRSTGEVIKTLSTEHCSSVSINGDGALIAAGCGAHLKSGMWPRAKGCFAWIRTTNGRRRWISLRMTVCSRSNPVTSPVNVSTLSIF